MSFCCTPVASAAEPTRELSPAIALRLVALRTNIPVGAIETAFIVDGEVRVDVFQASDIRRVAAIHLPINQRRRLIFHDVYWNDRLGWFLWEPRVAQTGDSLFIWSKLRGAIVNR